MSGDGKVELPTIHLISDSVGWTAQMIARAAASQFGDSDPHFEFLNDVRSFAEIEAFFETHMGYAQKLYGKPDIVAFYTLVDRALCRRVRAYVDEHPCIHAVDFMSDALDAIATITGSCPVSSPGELRTTDASYFRRIEAMEFTIDHDDGMRPQDLPLADAVLIGVSRSGKTPTSIYLSQQGLRVSNVPLDPLTDPPKELFDVESSRIFGLVTTPDVLVGIRSRRLGRAACAANSYATLEQVTEDLEKARALMRRLGAIVIHTENRAVEETAQEILSYYMLAHPHKTINL